MVEVNELSQEGKAFLEPYLPPLGKRDGELPFVTLT